MRSSTAIDRTGAPSKAAVRPSPSGPSERESLGLLVLGLAACAFVAVVLPWLPHGPSRAAAGEGSLLVATVTAAGVVLQTARRGGAWLGTRLVAIGLGVAGVSQAGGWVNRSFGRGPPNGELFAATVSVLLLMFLATSAVDFFEHIREGRAELLSDVFLLSTLGGAAVFLLVHESAAGTSSAWTFMLTAFVAACAILLVSGYGVLTLWCPTPVHVGLFTCATLLSASAIGLGNARWLGWSPDSLLGPEAAAGLSLLGLAAILVVEPRLNAGEPRPPREVRWIRPGLLTLSLCGACVLVVVGLVSRDIRVSVGQSIGLAVVVFGTVGLRTLLNQIAIVRSSRALEGALEERESAIGSLRAAADVVKSSEARLRLLLDAAVDGVVELDARGTVVRANGAFCSMVHLPLEEVLGRPWTEMVRRSGGGESLASLPETGEAMVVGENGALYLEARSSKVPTSPPGTLLMIRDVTASKTAEQTIRTLFQFLQDRDEDRTRLLQRSNTAIEAERNRIARDLHDGPIQGVSAASLSLEAVKLMMEAGDTARALDTVKKICEELGEEAFNLRRIMSDLRPPLLEQRGLIPAVRELCEKWQSETEVPVQVIADAHGIVPSDLETLAYRVVQEALSNVKKHAGATEVTVRIEASGGSLRVEAKDNGSGFDPEDARQFLRAGKVGLASMRERAELAGGTLTVKSAPGTGTSVTATLPFEVLATAPQGGAG
ncbi:MAG TPA: ATP-binding protein [Actinomycetota bacterium]